MPDRPVDEQVEQGPKMDSQHQHQRSDELYVIFDGPPSHESGRFVEVENAAGCSVRSGAEWKERADGFWSLGPFHVSLVPECGHCEDRHTVEYQGQMYPCPVCIGGKPGAADE